jgi:assimilatory nitrate reductase catalytic subunit
VEKGEIRGLWIIATNPGHSWIARSGLPESLGRLDFLVVQDLYSTTETVRMADLVLPAAGSGEKYGSFINSERRLGAVNRIVSPPGEARADFEIFKLLAEAWGCAEMFHEWSDPQAAFQILKKLSAGRPCDITGILDHRELVKQGGVQWPWTAADALAGTPETHRRLFADGKFFTPSGRAKFLFDPERPLPEAPDAEYPFLLNTGRGSVVQWHTQTRTGKVDMLNRLRPADAYIELNPADAESLGLAEGSKVTVLSRRGRVLVDLKLDPGLRIGEAFMPMHYPETNLLTYPSFDAYSFEPSYKAAAVRIEK